MFYFIKICELPQHNVIIMDVPPNARHFLQSFESIVYKYNRQIKTLEFPFKIKEVVGRYQDCVLNNSLVEHVTGSNDMAIFNQIIERNDERGFVRKFNPLIVTIQK